MVATTPNGLYLIGGDSFGWLRGHDCVGITCDDLRTESTKRLHGDHVNVVGHKKMSKKLEKRDEKVGDVIREADIGRRMQEHVEKMTTLLLGFYLKTHFDEVEDGLGRLTAPTPRRI